MQIQRINWKVKGLVTMANLAYELDAMSKPAHDKYNILCFWNQQGLQATIDAFDIKKRTLYYWRARLKTGGKLALNDGSKIPKTKRKRQWDHDVVDEIKYLKTPLSKPWQRQTLSIA